MGVWKHRYVASVCHTVQSVLKNCWDGFILGVNRASARKIHNQKGGDKKPT